MLVAGVPGSRNVAMPVRAIQCSSRRNTVSDNY